MDNELWAEAERHRAELMRAAVSRVKNLDEAEDIVSECILRCVRSCQSIGALHSMLHRAVANRCIDAHRKKETMHRVVKQAVADGRFYAPYALAAMYDSDDSKYPIGVLDPKARRNFHRSGFVIERFPEDAIILRDLTDAIGEDYAQVVWLDYLDYDQQTAAELIGIEIGAYKTRLHRARARLKELYRAAMDIQDPKEG